MCKANSPTFVRRPSTHLIKITYFMYLDIWRIKEMVMLLARS